MVFKLEKTVFGLFPLARAKTGGEPKKGKTFLELYTGGGGDILELSVLP